MKRSMDDNSQLRPLKRTKLVHRSAMDYLVQDTLKLILSKLDPKNQRHARLVCKQWCNTINISEFSIGALYRDELPLVISVLGRYNKPISVSFKNLDQLNPDHILQLTRLTNLTSFSGNIQDYDIFLSALTNLQSLKTDIITTTIFDQLPNLTKLSCDVLAGELTDPVTKLEDIQILTEGCDIMFDNFPNLKRLETGAFNVPKFNLTRLESLVLPNATSCESFPVTLTRLDIPTFEWRQQGQIDRFYGHITTLTNLKHVNPSTLIQHILPCFPLLEKCEFVGAVQVNDPAVLKEIPKLRHLTSLHVNLGFASSLEDVSNWSNLLELTVGGSNEEWQLEMSLFSSLTQLTKVIFKNQDFCYGATMKNFASLSNLTALQHLEFLSVVSETFADNLTNLTTLRFGLNGDNSSLEKHRFSKLTNLEELIIDYEAGQLSDCTENLGELTQLTRLELSSGYITDKDWSQITKLTNLRRYVENAFIGTDGDRLADLTALQRLTSLIVFQEVYSYMEHLTALTSLQHVAMPCLQDQEKLLKIREQLPFHWRLK